MIALIAASYMLRYSLQHTLWLAMLDTDMTSSLHTFSVTLLIKIFNKLHNKMSRIATKVNEEDFIKCHTAPHTPFFRKHMTCTSLD